MKYKWYHTYAFWDSLAKTLGVLGGGGNVAMGITTEVVNQQPTIMTADFGPWQIVTGLLSLASMAIVPWLKDRDDNGILDFFDDYPNSNS